MSSPAPPDDRASARAILTGTAEGIGAFALQFTILTAPRTGEVANARWSEFEFDPAETAAALYDAADVLASGVPPQVEAENEETVDVRIFAMSSAKERTAARTILAGLFCAGAAFGTAQGQGASGADASIPNFAPSSAMGWLKAGVGDEFLPPDTGPGPVVAYTSQKFGSNF